MKIEIGKYYENKTWRFLLPCLRGHGEIFVKKFNPVFKLAVGICDTLLDGTNLVEGRNIYILCDKKYQEESFNQFLNWVKYQTCYVTDYCPDEDIIKSRKHTIVLTVPDEYYHSYDMFIESRYSKMYTKKELDFLFSNNAKKKEYDILSLNKNYFKNFLNIINKEFSSTVSLKEMKEDFKEIELPLKTHEEVLNCTSKNQRVFFKKNLNEECSTQT